MTFLQTAELTRETTRAAGSVTGQMEQQGPLFVLLWLLVLAACLIGLYFFLKYDKLRTDQAAAVQAAVQAAREEWARQQAIDNQHAADLLKQSRESEKDALNRIDTINRELRQQEVKSVEVIGGVRTALGQVYAILQTVQYQLQSIETIINPHRAATAPPPVPPRPAFDPLP